MAILFSDVRTSTPDGDEAEFLVSGIPREFDDLEHYTKFEDFLDTIDHESEMSVHAKAYLYGEGETNKASIEEVAYLTLRMNDDDRFLPNHCNNIESIDFTCIYSPEELLGGDWG